MGIQWDQLEPATGDVTDDTQLAALQPTTEGGTRRLKRFESATKFKTYFQGAEVAANTAYKNRVKTKLLWTGPLSVVSTPVSLNVGEKFSDWDIIEVHFNLLSDAIFASNTAISNSIIALTRIDAFSNTGLMRFDKLTDTTFQVLVKTVALGNIQRIIGIKL